MDLKSTSREQHRDVFVLSGGANRGAVQVGMLEVLLEHGIVPDALVGTSVGALNAAFMGIRPDRARVRELRARWMQLTTRDIFPGGTLTRMGHLLRQRPYLFSPAALTRLIDDWLPAENLEDLPTPVRVVTTPLTGDTAVYHRHGNLAQLLLASAAVPAVFPPVELPASCGHPGPHVDGGVADLVPISGAADLAPTRVFVLDASVPSRLPRGRTPIDILVASLGVATRVRPEPDLGAGVAVHRLRTPDLGHPDDRLLQHGPAHRRRPRRRRAAHRAAHRPARAGARRPGQRGDRGPRPGPGPPQHHPPLGPAQPRRLRRPLSSRVGAGSLVRRRPGRRRHLRLPERHEHHPDDMSVRVDKDGPVTTVTIDRPEARNAVDRPTAEALAEAFRAFDADDDRLRGRAHRRRWALLRRGGPQGGR